MLLPPLIKLGVVMALLAHASVFGTALNAHEHGGGKNNATQHGVLRKRVVQPSQQSNIAVATTKAANTKTLPSKIVGNCFSGENMVEVQSRGSIPMKDLRVGDMVKSADGNKMVRVYGFGPFQPNTKAEFLQIHAKGVTTPIEISRGHLVFVNGVAIPASEVQAGDKLDTDAGRGAAEVQKIKKVMRTGIYTPFTTSGTILVSGVAASSYVTLQEGTSVFMLGDNHRLPFFSMQWLAHTFHAIPRIMMSYRFQEQLGYNRSEEELEPLLSKWVGANMKVGEWLQQPRSCTVATAASFGSLLLLGLLLNGIEAAFDSAIVLWLIFALVVGTVTWCVTCHVVVTTRASPYKEAHNKTKTKKVV